MAAKEVMVSAPLIVLLYDRTFLAGSFRERRTAMGAVRGLAATWLLLAALVVGSGARAGTAGFGLRISPWQYALTQCRAIVEYLGLSFWPANLCLDHGDTVVEKSVGRAARGRMVLALLGADGLGAVAAADGRLFGAFLLCRARSHVEHRSGGHTNRRRAPHVPAAGGRGCRDRDRRILGVECCEECLPT